MMRQPMRRRGDAEALGGKTGSEYGKVERRVERSRRRKSWERSEGGKAEKRKKYWEGGEGEPEEKK